jgi:peptide/nickel transport system permease protein
MARFLLKRLGTLGLTVVFLTLVVFALSNLPGSLTTLAKTQASVRMTDADVAAWLERNGYDRPMLVRYGEWLGLLPAWQPAADSGILTRCGEPPGGQARRCGLLQGYWGRSTVFSQPVLNVILPRLERTAWLMMYSMLLLSIGGVAIGVLAGMREGSRLDRVLTTLATATTATPDYVWAVILIVIFASATSGISPWLHQAGLIETRTLFLGTATTAEDELTLRNFTLPVLAIALYGMGHVARMTRASMVEVMVSQYIRTARLKGLSTRQIVLHHALRNALITPFTVIMLQFPWLLNGVVIIEVIFNYKGFGWTVVQAAGNTDIELLMGCSVVAVTLVLVTQLVSDIGYGLLNPRIRVS